MEAIGLVVLFNYLKAKGNREVDKENIWEQIVTQLGFLVLYAGFALFSGWVVSLFM